MTLVLNNGHEPEEPDMKTVASILAGTFIMAGSYWATMQNLLTEKKGTAEKIQSPAAVTSSSTDTPSQHFQNK